MKKSILSFSILVALSVLPACSKMNIPSSISDIQGTWEGIQLGYTLMDIREDGKGYIVFTFEDEEEILEIKEINLAKAPCIITFQNLKDDSEINKAEVALFGKSTLILNGIRENSEKQEDTLFFMRESVVPGLKRKAKEIIEKQSHNKSLQRSGRSAATLTR